MLAELALMPAESFPVEIAIHDLATLNLVWSTQVDRPELHELRPVYIPGKDQTNAGRPVLVRIRTADGEITEVRPNAAV